MSVGLLRQPGLHCKVDGVVWMFVADVLQETPATKAGEVLVLWRRPRSVAGRKFCAGGQGRGPKVTEVRRPAQDCCRAEGALAPVAMLQALMQANIGALNISYTSCEFT